VPIDLDPTRTARGALAGAVAAAVWALQQPLDKLVFRSDYDDVEWLGRAVSKHRWRTAGLIAHLFNGAAFGAVYANAAPLLPLPAPLRGPAVAVAENSALWPLTRIADRFHPARDIVPQLSGNRRALAQSTWRHLLFGVVLGELERRLNAANPEPPAPTPEPNYASNGHRPAAQIVTAPVTLITNEPPDDPDA
jgi:hypothetical protein